ncbi:MAG TPA: HAD-IA family hydrolase [Lachnospiraceae bacterium]|nr:HAD-IA family hydrolase [Lachnospiraceae bacterium]
MTNKIEAVVFDMDGVLFDTERLCTEAWREEANLRNLGDMEKAIKGCVGLNLTDTKEFFLKEYGNDFLFDEFHANAGVRFKEKIEREGLPIKKGVKEILAYLKAAGYAIALASSTSKKGVLGHLQRTGLTSYFEEIISGDMVEHSKPQPDIYLMACKALHVDPQNAIAIEDSPNGIRSAYAAGMKPVMVPDLIAPTSEIESLLYAKCDSLLEVKELLQKQTLEGQEILRIPLDTLCNTRDLGGICTVDGKRIKEHRLLRSGALYGSTKEEQRVLFEEYQLRTIVDLRTGAEKQLKPDPQIPGVSYIDNPILEESTLGITRENEDSQDGNGVVKKVIASMRDGGITPLIYMENMYRNLITNTFSRKQYRKFFEILLAQKEGAILWHCSAGKDRVGVATILLLSALNVSPKQIMADYLKVNVFGKKQVDALLEQLKESEEAARLLFSVDPSYAESVFSAMEEECGSIDMFLEQEMGLNKEKRDQLREMYLE